MPTEELIYLMTMIPYASHRRKGVVDPVHLTDHAVVQKVTGIYCLAPWAGEPYAGEREFDVLEQLRDLCKEKKLDFVLGFSAWVPKTGPVTDIPEPNLHRIEVMRMIHDKLAVGSSKSGEWGAYRGFLDPRDPRHAGARQRLVSHAVYYQDLARRFDYEWVCPFEAPNFILDAAHGELKSVMGKTLIFSLAFYHWFGYFWGNPWWHTKFPGSGLLGLDPHGDFGITFERMQEYLAGMRVLSGAGYQTGLDRGARGLAHALGCKGVVIGDPFGKARVRQTHPSSWTTREPLGKYGHRVGQLAHLNYHERWWGKDRSTEVQHLLDENPDLQKCCRRDREVLLKVLQDLMTEPLVIQDIPPRRAALETACAIRNAVARAEADMRAFPGPGLERMAEMARALERHIAQVWKPEWGLGWDADYLNWSNVWRAAANAAVAVSLEEQQRKQREAARDDLEQ